MLVLCICIHSRCTHKLRSLLPHWKQRTGSNYTSLPEHTIFVVSGICLRCICEYLFFVKHFSLCFMLFFLRWSIFFSCYVWLCSGGTLTLLKAWKALKHWHCFLYVHILSFENVDSKLKYSLLQRNHSAHLHRYFQHFIYCTLFALLHSLGHNSLCVYWLKMKAR